MAEQVWAEQDRAEEPSSFFSMGMDLGKAQTQKMWLWGQEWSVQVTPWDMKLGGCPSCCVSKADFPAKGN